MRRRSFLKRTGVAGVAGLSGCLGSSGGGDDTLHMGGILPLTGGLANPAQWIERAWNLWADDINEDGGLLDREVEFTVYDSELDQGKMRTLTERLIQQDDVDVFVGPYPTLTMPVIAPILEQNDMTVVHQFWPRSHIKDKEENPDKMPRQFGFSAGNYTYPRAFVEYLSALPEADKPKTWAIVGRNDLYGKDGYDSFVEFMDGTDFEIVFEDYYDPGATSLSSLARSVKQQDPDVVAANSYMGDGILFMEGAADVDLHPDFYWVNVGPQVPEWIPSLGSAGEFVFGSTPYSYTVPTDANEYLYDVAQNEWGELPHYSYGFGYIQMQIYEQALRDVGEVDQAALKDRLETMNFDVVTGELEFDDRNFSTAPMYVTQVQGEDIETVWPEDQATADSVYPYPE